MQTDVKSATLSSSNTAFGGPARAKAIYIAYTATTGTVYLKDGGSGGTAKFEFNAPAVDGAIYMLFPGEGIRFETNLFVTINTAKVTVFYG